MKPKFGLERPSVASKSARSAATKLEEGEARLVVNLPVALHRKIKFRALEQEQTIREYILELLDKDGLS